jgi:drug/metabolite transporter (DMT)-like permease
MPLHIGHCLVFAGACLLAAAGLNTGAWVACLRTSQPNCEAPLAAAVASLTGAANAALGVALQDRKP